MDKNLANIGYILSLIGGILGLVIGFIFLVIGLVIVAFAGPLGIFFVLISLYSLITSGLVVVGAIWMKREKTLYKSSLMALICSVIGGGGILGLVGGILGLVASKN